MVTVPVEQPAPLQPTNVEPVAAVAVRVTIVPLLKLAEQVLPQLIPLGELLTVPLPVPDFATDSPNVWTTAAVVAHDSAEYGDMPLELKAKTR